MIGRYEVWLNGVALSSLDDKILILDVIHPATSIKNESYSLANRQGARIYRRYTEKKSITISFAIREYGIQERQRVCDEIIKWAKDGGILQTNDRSGQRLHCICENFPSVTSVMKWTDALQMTFSAFVLPYWEEIAPSQLTLSGTQGEGTLYVPGNVDEAVIGATIASAGLLSSVSISSGDLTMTLSGLSVASGGTIEIAYDDNLIQSIKNGNVSLLNKRTGADDLLARCGEQNHLSFTADASVSVTFNTRGLWL